MIEWTKKTNLQVVQARRKARRLAGLTNRGTKRINKRHPDLAGLTDAAYHLAYIRKQRAA